LKRLGYGKEGSGIDFAALKSHEFFKGLNFKKIQDGLINPPIPIDIFDTVLQEEEKKTNEDDDETMHELKK